MSASTTAQAYSPHLSTLNLLTVAFVVLKLTHVITWSWYLVLLPLWGPLALILGVVLLVVLGVGIVAFITHLSRK